MTIERFIRRARARERTSVRVNFVLKCAVVCFVRLPAALVDVVFDSENTLYNFILYAFLFFFFFVGVLCGMMGYKRWSTHERDKGNPPALLSLSSELTF